MRSLYLKSALWDFLLVLGASLGLGYTLLNCFYVSPDLQYGPVPAIVCVLVLLALFAAASSRRVARIAGPIVAAVLVVSWVVGAALTPEAGVLVDDEQNYLIFAMVATLAPAACFLLSRRLVGAALLFIAGSFIIAMVQFFYERVDVPWVVVFVAAAIALIVYRNYQLSLRTSSSVKKVAFAPGFVVALATCAAAAGVGCGVWFGVIAPLNPPAAEIKLITEYRALETVRVKGIADLYQIPNLDMTSDQTNDDERSTDDIKESEAGRQYPVTGKTKEETDPEDADSTQGSSSAGINLDVPDDMFDFLNYEQVRLALIIAAVVVLAGIVAYFVGRRVRRKRWLQRLSLLPPAQQVLELYPFFVSKFERLGWRVAPGQTPHDYAVANAATLEQFDAASGTSFFALTEDYVRAAYGNHALGQDAAARYAGYYNAFWKACRQKLGAFKYFFKSFRL